MNFNSRQLLVIGLSFIGLSSLFLLAIFLDQTAFAILVLIASLFFQMVVVSTRPTRAEQSDALNLLLLISSMYFIHFVARAIFLWSSPEEMMRFGSEAQAVLLKALLYTNIGFASLLVGYHSFVGRRLAYNLPPLACEMNKKRLFQTIFLLYVTGSLMRLVIFSQGWHLRYASGAIYGTLSPWVRVIDYLSFFCFFGFLLATLYVFYIRHARTSVLVLWFAMLGIEITTSALGGSKFLLLFAFFAPLMAWNYSRMQKKVWPLVAAAVVFIIIGWSILGVYRSNVDYDTIVGGGYGAALGEVLPEVASSFWSNPWAWLQELFVSVLTRFHGILSMMTIITGVPEFIDFQNGKTLLGVFTNVVPTFLWPAKDDAIVSAGNLMAMQLWFLGKAAASGIGTTQIGELYMNFGIIGVTMGMFLLGAFYRFVYTYLVERNMHLIGLFLYIYVVYWLLPIDFDFQLAFGNLIKQVFLFLLPIVWILNGGRFFDRTAIRAEKGTRMSYTSPLLSRQMKGSS